MRAHSGAFDVPGLDGLRAVSVLLVFFSHADPTSRNSLGNFGVTVFFFLSGYLITTLLRLEGERTGRISLGNFYLRRALRILPPMYAVLAAAIILTLAGVLPGTISAGGVAIQAIHFTNYFVIVAGWSEVVTGTAAFWSLAVEEHFYLLFPFGYILLRRYAADAARQAAVILTLCAAVLVWRLVLFLNLGATADRIYAGTDTRIDAILFGCFLAVFANPALSPTRIGPAWWKRLLIPVAVMGILASFLIRQPWFQETFRYSLQSLALYPIFVVAIRDPGWLPIRFLTFPVMRTIGNLSYVLYLVHGAIIDATRAHVTAHPVIQAALALVVSFAVAMAIHLLIERPSAGLRHKLASVHRSSGSDRTSTAATA